MKTLRKLTVALLLVATLFTIVNPSTCIFAEGNAILPSSANTTITDNVLDFKDSIYNRGPNHYNMGNYYVFIYPNYLNDSIYYDLIVEPASASTSTVTLSIGTGNSYTNVLEVTSTLDHGGPNEITDTEYTELTYGITYNFVLYFSMGRETNPDAYGTAYYLGSFSRSTSSSITAWNYELS